MSAIATFRRRSALGRRVLTAWDVVYAFCGLALVVVAVVALLDGSDDTYVDVTGLVLGAVIVLGSALTIVWVLGRAAIRRFWHDLRDF